MALEHRIRVLAGSIIILGLLLSYLVSPAWQILVWLVALNLIQSAFTRFCPAERILCKISKGKGVQSTCCKN